MPRILEEKLKKEYPGNDHAVYGTLNKIGAMKGNKETKKGKNMEKALSNRAKVGRIFSSHGSHLTDEEYQNSLDKYDAQRKKRKN